MFLNTLTIKEKNPHEVQRFIIGRETAAIDRVLSPKLGCNTLVLMDNLCINDFSFVKYS